MKIGIPKESMPGEGRVALVPDDCQNLIEQGLSVCIEHGAGVSSGYADRAYKDVGVDILLSAAALYQDTDLIVKVKQPLDHELQYMRSDQLVFSYLHLAADEQLVDCLCDIGLTAIPFESVTNHAGEHPLLAPMSAIAGRLSVIRGAHLLFGLFGGRGVLLGGIDGADTGRVVVLGAGVAGSHAITTALDLGAEVHVFDLIQKRLDELKTTHPAIITHLSEPSSIAEVCKQADLVVGAVMVAGRRAPVVLTEAMIKGMLKGSVIVDIAIDQGGCVEEIRTTSYDKPAYVHYGVVHSAVPNMPGAVPRTASQSLSSVIVPYVSKLAQGQLAATPELQDATAIEAGSVVDPVLKDELESVVV